jgi:hypothetical protein
LNITSDGRLKRVPEGLYGVGYGTMLSAA